MTECRNSVLHQVALTFIALNFELMPWALTIWFLILIWPLTLVFLFPAFCYSLAIRLISSGLVFIVFEFDQDL